MTTTGQQPRGVHLVGSIPLGNAEEVFRTASAILGDRLRRIPDQPTLTAEVAVWEQTRNANGATVNWRFTTADARIKLKRLYPSIED